MNFKFTAEAVLRHSRMSICNFFKFEFQVYCGSGIETQMGLYFRSLLNEFQVYCGSGIETFMSAHTMKPGFQNFKFTAEAVLRLHTRAD